MSKKRSKTRPGPTQLWGDLSPMFETVHNESPRGAILVAASYIDALLGALLEAQTIEDNDLRAKLFERGSLSNFATRTDLAYGLGLISESAYYNIGQFRQMRNTVAHSYESPSQWEADLALLAKSLKLPTGCTLPRSDDPSTRFEFVYMVTITHIRSKTKTSRPPQSPANAQFVEHILQP